MKRADHYLVAEQLLEQASEDQDKASRETSITKRAHLHGEIRLYLRAAQIHAQLACAGPGVEQEVADLLKRAAPSQAERQTARRPLPTVLSGEQSSTAFRPKPGPPPHAAGKERS
ncbi:MAG TPA: hypothetical protein VLL08_23035 [Kineosporiaceae bacterium]|nr:hypothetical protein [Kineosporiaceae bacterium]